MGRPSHQKMTILGRFLLFGMSIPSQNVSPEACGDSFTPSSSFPPEDHPSPRRPVLNVVSSPTYHTPCSVCSRGCHGCGGEKHPSTRFTPRPLLPKPRTDPHRVAVHPRLRRCGARLAVLADRRSVPSRRTWRDRGRVVKAQVLTVAVKHGQTQSNIPLHFHGVSALDEDGVSNGSFTPFTRLHDASNPQTISPSHT